MDPAELARFIERNGFVLSRAQLLTHLSRPRLHEAVANGEIVRLARGRYSLPETDATLQRAGQLKGTVILLSAALQHGWAIKHKPQHPQVAVSLGRNLKPAQRKGVDIKWRDLPDEDRIDGVTTPLRTVLDCGATLPFDEALCVADSALRAGLPQEVLVDALPDLPRLHRRRVERVVRSATPLAANPFESCLRAVCLDIPGLSLEPQVSISDKTGFVGRVDLADRRLRLILEAESHEFHSGKDEFDRDCLRYTRLTVADWTVLRFPWAPVMGQQHLVRSLTEDGAALCEARLAAGARLARRLA